MQKYNVVIVEDQSITLMGLVSIFKNMTLPIEKVVEVQNGDRLMPILEKEFCDLLILDLDIPGENGMILLKKIKNKFPNIKVIIFTTFEGEGFFREAFILGADAYVLKTDDISLFPEVVRRVLVEKEFYCSLSLMKFLRKNNIQFSEKEFEIMQYLKKEYSVTEIADKMLLSRRTIEYYINRLKEKLSCRSISDLKKEIKNKYYKESNFSA